MPAYKFVEDIMKPWLVETRHQKKMKTLQNEAYCTKPLMEFFKGWYVSSSSSRRMKIIDGVAVSQYREWRKLTVAPETAQHELRFAVTACNHAIRMKNYEMPNPFAGRTMSAADQKAGRVTRTDMGLKGKWTLSEEKRFMLAAPPFVADVVGFALSTGCRLGEILELVYEDVYKGKTYERIDGRKLIFSPADQKSSYWGSCYMNDEACRILSRQTSELIDGKLYAFPYRGKALDNRKWNGLFTRVRKAAGLSSDLKMQNTRKAAGQRMLDAGADLEGVQAQLRHRSLKTTEGWYVQPSDERARQAVEMTNR